MWCTRPRRRRPCCCLGGDVHCNYTAAAELTNVEHPVTKIHQLTMSPFRNDIPRVGKLANQLLNRRSVAGFVHRMARWAKVADVDLTWHVEHGPWFDNGVMIVEFAGRSARLRLDHARLEAGQQTLATTLDVELQHEEPTAPDDGSATATD